MSKMKMITRSTETVFSIHYNDLTNSRIKKLVKYYRKKYNMEHEVINNTNYLDSEYIFATGRIAKRKMFKIYFEKITCIQILKSV